MDVLKNYRLLLKILPFFLVAVLTLILYKKPISITKTAAESSALYLTPFGDEVSNGNSWAMLLDTVPQIRFRYTLGNKIPFPFAGLTFYMRNKSFWDLRGYDHLKIKIKATAGTRLPIAIHCFIPSHNKTVDFNKPEDFNSYLRLQYMALVSEKWKEINIPLKSYEVPNWWYAANNLTEHDLGKPDLSKVVAISIANCTNLKAGDTDEVDIEELSFYKDMFPFYIYSGGFLFLYFGVWWLLVERKKRKSKKEITFQYKKLETVNEVKSEEDIIFDFITSNYFRPELTIIDVQNVTGVHERKISATIKKKTDLNFKQFLNKLRISEAKRLLLESDLQVSEIALKTGYANPTHFNRVFKSSEECSPNDFRKKNKVTK